MGGTTRGRGRRWLGWTDVVRTPLGASAAFLLGVVVVLVVVAPILWTHRANVVDTNALSQGTSGAHWLGTDNLGRDLFHRVLVASRLSVELALLATAIGVLAGVLLGSLPWLLGRRLGRLATAVVNIAVAFPGLLLALFFAVIFGVGAKGAVLAIGVATAPWYARVTSTLIAGVEDREYVAAARTVGLGRGRILLRHILPNIGEPLIVNATIGAGGALVALSGLSFLGLGVQAPSYDWGQLLNQGLDGIYVHPAGALAPGVAIVVAGLAFNLSGEAAAKHLGVRVAVVPTGPAGGPKRAADPVDNESAVDSAEASDVLVVEDLSVTVPGPSGPLTPVRGVSFTIGRGEAVGVVGESGSGKSLTASAVAQLVEPPGRVTAAQLRFQGSDLLAPGSPSVVRKLLGTTFGMVFQDPTTSFNPTMRVGAQLAETARHHQGLDRRAAMVRAVDRLRAARVPAPARRAGQYPHEYSGGMRQRAMIGMAMMGEPALIVADEPTTALDVTVQHQILRLLRTIREGQQVAILLISHDISVITQVCDRVLVMYAGRIVESLPSRQLRSHAAHPYTRALLAAVPDMTTDRDQPLAVIPGQPVDPAHQPQGCAYAARCPLADQQCQGQDPALTHHGPHHRVACWHADPPTDPPTPGARNGRARSTSPVGEPS